jgi:hypothetical protein
MYRLSVPTTWYRRSRFGAAAALLALLAGILRAEEPLVREFQMRDPMAYGRHLYAKGRLDAAMREFELARREHPESLVPLRYMARIRAQRGEYPEAIDGLYELQQRGLSILLAPDCRTTLGVILRGIAATEDLTTRAGLLVQLKDTLLGLPSEFLWTIEAHLIAIYAKTDSVRLRKAKLAEYFQDRKVTPMLLHVLCRVLLAYDVNARDAAAYAEQALALLLEEKGRLVQTNDPERDRLVRRTLDARIAAAKGVLACAYDRAGLRDMDRNQLLASEAAAAVTFREVTETSGLKDVTGWGIAVGDYDGDGLQDIAVAGRVFRNSQGTAFLDVTDRAGLSGDPAHYALWLDADGDGDLDLLLGSLPRLALWQNQGDGRFTDVTASFGLDMDVPGVPAAVAATDFDQDGVLDLFVGCTVKEPERGDGQPNLLLRGLGQRFEDVTAASGLGKAVPLRTRGAAWGDANDDGWPDLYEANDREGANRLWINQRNGSFVDRAEVLGVRGEPGHGRYASFYGPSVGCAWGDVDSDGLCDLVVANRAYYREPYSPRTVRLLLAVQEQGTRRFVDRFRKCGIPYEDACSSVSLCDIDNDGDLDIYLGCPHPMRPAHLCVNDGRGQFRNGTWRAGLVAFHVRGHVWLDKDNDGDMDLIAATGEGMRVFENLATDASWLRVRLSGTQSNRHGIGSKLTVTAGQRRLVRYVSADTGTGSQPSGVVHVGLGKHAGPVSIDVRWPDGHVQTRENVRARSMVTIDEK